MQIRLATYLDRNVWDNFVLTRPEGTAYQLFAWQEAVTKAYAFNGYSLLAERNNAVCGVLPLIDFRVPLAGRALISLPYCDAGGILAEDRQVEQKLLDHALTAARSMGACLKIRTTTAIEGCDQNGTDKVRTLLDLPDSFEKLEASLKAKVRSQVRKPLRDGLQVRVGDSELVNTFYDIFAENMRDLGSPVHSRTWIEAVVSAFGERSRVVVVYAPNGQPAAAGIALIHPGVMSIPWASSLRRYNHLNANMLLYRTFLNQAIDSGCRNFDFGRSTPGEGTYRFKKQWGAAPRPLYWVSHPPNKNSSGRGGAGFQLRSLAEGLWRHTPLAVCNALGPVVRRCINL